MPVTIKTGNLKYKNSNGQYVGIGAVGLGNIEEAVDDWLGENITNPDSPPLDRSLSSSSSAAPADLVGDLNSALSEYVVEKTLVDVMSEVTPQNLRIDASTGATVSNQNWNAYVIDIEDIDESFSAKLFDTSTSYAVIAFYTSKTTFSSQTLVGTPMTASTSNSYLMVTYSDLTIPSGAVCALLANNRNNGTEAYIKRTTSTKLIYSKEETDDLIEAAVGSIDFEEIHNAVFEEIDIDFMETATVGNLRITASTGATESNQNWNSYLLDIEDIDESFNAKLYSSSTGYAVGAFYSSKSTISDQTFVGSAIVVDSSNSYKEITYSDLTIPQTAVCAVFVNNVNGSQSYIKGKKTVTKAYTKAETDEIIKESEEKMSGFSFLYNVNADNTLTKDQAYNDVNGVATSASASEWWNKVFDVKAGEIYTVTASIYGSVYYAVLLTDNSYNVISKFEKNTSDSYKVVTVKVVIPTGVTKMIVNTKESGTSSILLPSKLRVKKEPVEGIGGRFTILAANCNGFPDGESSDYPLPTSEYKTNWRTMLNDCQIDFMAISEYNHGDPSTFGGEPVQTALFADSMPFFRYITNSVGQATACRLQGTHFINRIRVTDSVTYDGETYTTEDKHVMKTEVIVNGIPVVIYSVKLCPSGADPTPTKLAWTKAMRQAQYQDILTDIATYGYTHYIICGDFNAQDCSQDNEYKIFTDAGLTICNGGYLGWFNTLRNINTDNIIFPSTIRLVRFKVLDEYTLNTDHKPIMAVLQINPIL